MDFLEHGYKHYTPRFTNEGALHHWQKRMKNDYFLNIYEWSTGFEAEVQLTSGKDTVNVQLMCVESIEHTEQFFNDMFIMLDAVGLEE